MFVFWVLVAILLFVWVLKVIIAEIYFLKDWEDDGTAFTLAVVITAFLLLILFLVQSQRWIFGTREVSWTMRSTIFTDASVFNLSVVHAVKNVNV